LAHSSPAWDAGDEAFQAFTGVSWQQGSATFQYANDGSTATTWYHDHTPGTAHLQLYAGLCGLYRVQGAAADRRAGIPLIIQDRAFSQDGSLFYPAPDGAGDTMVVNGRTWPMLYVRPQDYRFQIVNACTTRLLALALTADPLARPARLALPFLPSEEAAASQAILSLPPGVCTDVRVDFRGMRPGSVLYLINLGPDPGDAAERWANPGGTGQVMQVRVR
jgi:FtsP/CotA-like multicopper oxidase with cupredoxin domain